MNVYLRIGLAAAAATYLSPRIKNAVLRAELTPTDETINVALSVGVTGITCATVFHVLGMAFGGKPASVAGGGGAS